MTSIRAPGRNVTVGEAVKKLNPHIFGVSGAIHEVKTPSSREDSAQTNNRVSQRPASSIGRSGDNAASVATGTKSPEEKLNKLERRWLAVLRTRYPNPGIQNITLRLSYDLRYTPDLNSNQWPLVFFETKGPHRFREKGILKLRWASKEYPHFDFVLVEWDKDSGWKETPIAKE